MNKKKPHPSILIFFLNEVLYDLMIRFILNQFFFYLLHACNIFNDECTLRTWCDDVAVVMPLALL